MGNKNKGRKGPNNELRQGAYLVETTLGNCIVAEGSNTLVNIVNDLFLQKSIQELNEGDMVIYHKQGIEKTLEEVEPFLTRSLRYEDASRRLFADDGSGNKTPVFRSDLVALAASFAGISSQVVDANLFKPNDADFNANEYTQMVQAVHLILEGSGVQHKYADATIQSWLTGETLAPRDWGVFDALSQQSDAFRKYNLPKSEGGLHDHYTLYVVVRQGIMRYLSTKGSRKNHSEKEEEARKIGRISLAKEIDIVLSQFMEDLNDDYALARVTKIKKLEPISRQIMEKRDQKLKLTRRVVTNESAQEYGTPLSYTELMQDYSILQHVLKHALGRYFQRSQKDPFYTLLLRFGNYFAERYLLVGSMCEEELLGFGGSNKTGFISVSGINSEMMEEIRHSIDEVGQVYSRMVDGTMDHTLSLEQGQTYGCFKATLGLNQNMPSELYKLRKLRYESCVSGHPIKWDDQTIKLAKRIFEKYNYEAFPREKIKHIFSGPYLSEHEMNFDFKMLEDDAAMLQLIDLRKRFEMRLDVLTRPEVEETLRRYGIPHMMQFVHNNEFLCDAFTLTKY